MKKYLQLLSVRQNLVLLGVLLIALATAATTYLALQQQEVRKRAQTACESGCNTAYDVCAQANVGACTAECAGLEDPTVCINACLDRNCIAGYNQCIQDCNTIPQCNIPLGNPRVVCCPGTNFGQTVQDFTDGSGAVCRQSFGDCSIADPSCSQGPCPGNEFLCPDGVTCSIGLQCPQTTQPPPNTCTWTLDASVAPGPYPIGTKIYLCDATSTACASQGVGEGVPYVCQSDGQFAPIAASECALQPAVNTCPLPSVQCNGTLTSTATCPPTLTATWDATGGVAASCTISVSDPGGTIHVVDNVCTSSGTTWTSTLPIDGASIINGSYRLLLNNGSATCFDSAVGSPATVSCTQETPSCTVNMTLSNTTPQASQTITATITGTNTVPANDWDNVGFFRDNVQQPCTSSSLGNYSCTVDTGSPGQHALEFRKHITSTPVVCTATGQTTFNTTSPSTAEAPRASMSVNGVSVNGPVDIRVGTAANFSAEATGTNLRGIEIFRARAGTQTWTRIAGSATSCIAAQPCQASGTWTPTAAELAGGANWITAVNAYSDTNGDGINQPNENCSGNPNIPAADLAAGWVRCGRSGVIDNIAIRIISATATSTPIPTATRTPTPTLPSGVTPTRTPTPTLPPGVSPTRTPTPTGGVTGLPTGGPTLGPNDTGLLLSLTLEGFPGTRTPTRKTEPITIELRSETTSISARGTLTYSEVARRFEGLLNLGGAIGDGVYRVFVKASSYLRRDLGTITIQSRIVNVLEVSPDKPLLSCDFNNDNIVNMLDINQVYTDIRNANVKDSLADIDRDGKVSIFDHNFCVQNFLEKGD